MSQRLYIEVFAQIRRLSRVAPRLGWLAQHPGAETPRGGAQEARAVELVEQVDALTERGLWAVRSESSTVYLLDTRRLGEPVLMRLSQFDGRGMWDGCWVPLITMSASPQLDLSVPDHTLVPGTEDAAWIVRLGSRHLWVVETGSVPAIDWMWSRKATSIQRLGETGLAALQADHDVGSPASRVPAKIGVVGLRARLEEALGPKLVGFIAGEGPEASMRLRTAAAILRLLTEKDAETVQVVRAWMIGQNPSLDDRSPAEMIATGRLREALTAARAFAAGG